MVEISGGMGTSGEWIFGPKDESFRHYVGFLSLFIIRC